MRLASPFLLLALISRASPAGFPLAAPVADLPLPGPPSRFDYGCLDPSDGRLFLNHMGAGEVVVVDAAARKVIATLPGFSRCTGILAVPSRNEIYVSAPGAGQVAVLDSRSLKVLARMPAGRFPDGLAYDPVGQQVFVSDESGGRVHILDARAHRALGGVAMGGEVGNTQYDPVARLIYSNVQTRNQLVAIDPATRKEVARVDLPGADHNHGLCLDPERRLAFIACEGNAKLLVLDLETRKVTASFSVGGDPDVLAFDPGARRLVVAAESGPAAFFHEEGRALVKDGEQRVGANAHVVVVDPATHLLYFPLKDERGRPLLRVLAPVSPAPGASPPARR
jgi:DNA-binding beta-propeller fold protein YncE